MAREFFPGMGQAVAERTILRKKEDGSWETWEDVANRVALGNSLLCKTKSEQVAEYENLKGHISNAVLLMSGRHLQHGDENQPTRNMEVFTNCCVTNTSFALFYLLCNGSGCGRCYDDDMMLANWDHSPTVRCVLSETHPDFDYSAHESVRDAKHKYGNGKDVLWHTVADTREGWAKALEIWENSTFEKIHKDKLLILDFSEIRPKGTPIKGMQNRPASGPVPLMNAFAKAFTLKGAGLPRWLQAIYIDHYFAECVLVGGARRAARMSTKSWRDKTVFDFITVKRPIEYHGKSLDEIQQYQKKHGKPQAFLWSSNNSIMVDQEFWDLLALSKRNPKYNSRIAKHARKVFRLATVASYADGTGEPGFINVDKLNCNRDGIELLAKGDYLGSKKYELNEDTHLYMRKLLKSALKKKHWMLVNPCVTADTSINTSKGFKQISQLINKRFVAVVNGEKFNCHTGFFKTGMKPVYLLQTDSGHQLKATKQHEILVVDDKNEKIWKSIGDLKINDSCICANGEIATISSIDYCGVVDVYDCTVAKSHCFEANGLIAHNCGEITISIMGGFCTIADLVPYFAETIEEAEDAARAVARALIRVNTMDSIFKKEVQRTNRIGVGLTGIHEFAWKFFKFGFLDLIDEEKSKSFWMALSRLKRAVQDEAEKYSRKLGLNTPHTDTTVKPSGTVSKLFGLSEGWHLIAMAYYMRWVQFREDDPLIQQYESMGYPIQKLTQYKNTVIVGFPTVPLITQLGMGDKLVTAAQATPEQQYTWIKLCEKYWLRGVDENGEPLKKDTSNQVSYTLKYDPELVDYKSFARTLRKYQPQIKCCSIMPQEDTSSYEYLPEQPVTKAEYEAVVAQIKKKLDEEIGFEHVDCKSGACPIDFKENKDQ